MCFPIFRRYDTLNRIEIFKDHVLYNYDLYQQLNPKSSLFLALKGNAYGHGLEQVAEILKERMPTYIVVDSYYETLRVHAVSKKFQILVIGYTKPQNYKYFNFKRIAVTVYDFDSIKALGQLNRKINIHLKIDTGMHRQGVYIEDLPVYLSEIKKYPKLVLEGVLSHFADADNPDNSYIKKQQDEFELAVSIIRQAGFTPKYVHLSNSSGATKINSSSNAVRSGLGLYGYNTLMPRDDQYDRLCNLKPCMRFVATIVQVKGIKKGDSVGYSRTYKAPEDMQIGIVSVGYYEGVDRRLSNKGMFTYQGKELPILGRVSMNLTIIDARGVDLKTGDEVTVISECQTARNSVQSIATQIDTIPYVITTKLSESVRRVIV